MTELSGCIRLDDPDIGRAAKTLARAFLNDPMMAYIFPDEPEIENKLSILFEVIARYGLMYGEVYAVSGNMEGVAMWLTSDNSDMDLLKLEKCGFDDFSSRVSIDAVARLKYLNDYAYSRNKLHAPFRHWYLAFIGVDPVFQAKGYASALIKPMLARMDKENMPCYLETATEKNVLIYEHFGFKLIEKFLVPNTDVYFYAMLRGKKTV